MRRYVKGLLDEGSFFEIQALWAREVTVGFGRLDGEVVGVVGNNSMFKGGVLFVDSADKATRFVPALRRVQRAAAVPVRRARASWSAPPWRSRASSGTAPR